MLAGISVAAHLCILFSAIELSVGQEAVHKGGDDASVDPYVVSKQWEDYGKSVAKALSDEKTKTATLNAEVDKLKTRVSALETTIEQKDSLLKSIEEDLSSAGLAGHGLKAQLAKLVTDAAEKEALEAEVKELQNRAERAEKVAATTELQAKKLVDAESALSYAKGALQKAQKEAEEKMKELQKVTGSFLPPWAKERLSTLQKRAHVQWEEYGKPAVSNLHKKATEGAAAARTWADPHLVTVQKATEKLSPVVKKHWGTVAKHVGPHWQTARGHAHKGYKAASDFVKPHAEKVAKFSEPYVKVVREKSKVVYDSAYEVVGPHWEEVAKVVRPHWERAQGAANGYHEQLRSKVKETLETHVGVKDATPNFVWYLASALVLLPVLLAFVVGWPLLRGEPKAMKVKPQGKSSHKKAHYRRPKRD